MKFIFKTLILALIFNFALAKTIDKKELEEMNEFLSYFTEVKGDFNDITAKTFEENIDEFIGFIIMHLTISNKLEDIEKEENPCPEKRKIDENGSEHINLGLSFKYLNKKLDEFFGYKIGDEKVFNDYAIKINHNDYATSNYNNNYVYENGCYYLAYDWGEFRQSAMIKSVKKLENKVLLLQGITYLDGNDEFEGGFIAKVKEKNYKGKKSWNLISFKQILLY